MGSKGVLRDSPELPQKPSSAVLGINRQEISSHNLPMIVGKVRCNTHTQKKTKQKQKKKEEKESCLLTITLTTLKYTAGLWFLVLTSVRKKQAKIQPFNRWRNRGWSLHNVQVPNQRVFLPIYKVTDFVLIKTFLLFSLVRTSSVVCAKSQSRF